VAEGAEVVPIRARRARGRAGSPARWAVALAAAVAAVSLGIRVTSQGGDVRPTAVATYVAEAGRTRTVLLGDGSVARLAAGSRLEESDRADVREVSLEGRAFFAATHDAARPLTVRTAAGAARVLGTRFEVFETADGLRVVVVEGRVAVSNDSGVVEVDAGSVAYARPDAPPVVEVVSDVFAFLDWPEGVLIFRATPFAQVADEVGRHFGTPVEVRGEELRAMRITARFEEQSFEDVVLALCDVSGAECSFAESGAVVSPPR
jgi:transmembrane sensor